MADAAQTAFALAYQISPIILTGGIAAGFAGGLAGGMLPIVAITNALSFVEGLLSGSDLTNLSQYLAQFHPLPGGTIIAQTIGEYPFANQATAANATIAQPLDISMRMNLIANAGNGYISKVAMMLALQAALAAHNNSGGTYTVLTPAFIYTNCILLRMADISNNQANQPQNAYQLDFRKPLITQSDAQAAQSSLMQKLSNGAPTDGTLSGIAPTVGDPSSVAGPVLFPPMANLTAATISPPSGNFTLPSIAQQ